MDALSPTAPSGESAWQRFLDRTGVCASIGCAVHCMVAPLLLVMTPALGGIWVHPVAHIAIASLVLPVAAFALRRGFREHGKRWIVTTGVLGMALVLAGAFWPLLLGSADAQAADAIDGCAVCHDCCPSVAVDETTGAWSLRVPPASVITLLGGIALVTAHLGNLRACACCRA